MDAGLPALVTMLEWNGSSGPKRQGMLEHDPDSDLGAALSLEWKASVQKAWETAFCPNCNLGAEDSFAMEQTKWSMEVLLGLQQEFASVTMEHLEHGQVQFILE